MKKRAAVDLSTRLEAIVSRVRRWPVSPYYALFLALFLLLDQAVVSGDGMAMYVVAESLLSDFDFDLLNQHHVYENELNSVYPYAIVHVEETGRYTSCFPFGITVFWAPFLYLFWAIHAAGWLPETYPLFGYVFPGVFRAIGLAVVVCANLSLVAAWRLGVSLAARNVPRLEAETIAFLFAVGTPLLFYATIEPSFTHVVNALAVSSLLWAFVALDDDRLPSGVAIGLIAGLGILVRWHLSTYIVLFGVVELWHGRWKRLAGMVVGTSAVVWVIPYSWLSATGSFFQPPILATQSGVLSSPKPVEMLLSDLRGLLPWSPVATLGLVGLLVGCVRRRRYALVFMLCVLAQLCVDSLIWDWWAGHSFGQRRLVNLYPLLVIGGAWFLQEVRRLAPRLGSVSPGWAQAAALGLAGVLAWHTFTLALHYYPSRLTPGSMTHSLLWRDWRTHGTWRGTIRHYLYRQHLSGLFSAWVGPEGGAKPDIAAAQSGTVPRLGIDEVWAIGDEIVVTGAAFTPNLVINLHQVRDGAPRNLGGVSEAGLVRIPYKFISPNRLTFIRPGSLESGTATVQLIALPYSEGTASEGVSVRIDPPTAGERRLYRRATPGGEGAGRAR